MKTLAKRLGAAFDGIITAMFGPLEKTGWAWARVGLAILFIAAAMSFDFGYQVSLKHGAFLAGLTFVAAFGPDAAHRAFQTKRWASGTAIAAGAIICLALEFVSHQSYTAGIRGDNISTAGVQNAKYTGSQKAVSEDEAALTREQTALSQLKTAHPWAATVTADSLRAQLPAIDEKLRQEEKRGGCGPKCLAIKQEKADVEGRIATAESRNGIVIRITDLEKRLEGRRAKADTTEHKSSPVAHANQSIADAFQFIRTLGSDLQPSESVEKGSQISINFGMALAGTGLPALCLFIAGLYRREETESPLPQSSPMAEARHHRPVVAQPRRKWSDIYKAQCNTMGIAPVTT
jgi:hypothetical protein